MQLYETLLTRRRLNLAWGGQLACFLLLLAMWGERATRVTRLHCTPVHHLHETLIGGFLLSS